MNLLQRACAVLALTFLGAAAASGALAQSNDPAKNPFAPRPQGQQAAPQAQEATYSQNEILEAARGFFGQTTADLAQAIERIFADQGRPNAYITGEEVSGAIGVGVRYGEGQLNRKAGGGRKVFWQGPSVGWDLGGNASKVFTLIYDLPSTDALFQRFPGVEGSAYLVGGVSVTYLRSSGITLAPIRTGVGLRLGANIGYMHFTREHSWLPL